MSKPRSCADCGTAPVAWSRPRVDYCYHCLPGGPFTPPPCTRCGSSGDYFTAGLCERCHPWAPQYPASCRDCYAWGVLRKHRWRCWGCRSWRTKFPIGTCAYCRRQMVRDGLQAADPARAVLTALLAFHAPRPAQLRHLQLTDVRDGRIYLPDRTILLAEPVRARLAAYLDHRNTRWPNTANPHLFIHTRSALGVWPVGLRWIRLHLTVPAHDVRADRILHEVQATGGDLRKICDLFGLSIEAAVRYTAVLDHPGLTTQQG